MVLAREVPATITAGIADYVHDATALIGHRPIHYWAVHPGGRAILDAVCKGLNLSENDVATSLNILRRYGNMSSATVMFVLEALLQQGIDEGNGLAMAFGPGLSAEGMLFKRA